MGSIKKIYRGLIFLIVILPSFLLADEGSSTIVAGDVAWMLSATALVLLMTPGLSYFYGGMVHSKNVISTMLQSFICMGLISIFWVVCGFSLAFGKSLGGFIGDPRTYFMFKGVGGAPEPIFSATIPFALYALFQLKFAIITPALVSGSFAERVKFSAYILFCTLFSILVYCPIAHWTWHPEGFLRVWGVLDFAGGTVVHMSAGIAALSGALFLGRRKVHIERRETVPANVPFVLLGTGMLWFGWFGFNAGSALAANEAAVIAFLTTNTASASAMLTWLLVDRYRGKKPSGMGACIGAVVGLVAITPAAGFVDVGASILIGAIAAVISNFAVGIRDKSDIDDTLDVFPCHGLGGIAGMILTGIFAKDVGLIYGGYGLFKYHLLGVLIVSAYSMVMSFLIYKVVSLVTVLRVSEKDEDIGLDLSQHGESIFAEIKERNPKVAYRSLNL